MSKENQVRRRRRCWFGILRARSKDMFLRKKADEKSNQDYGDHCFILELPPPIVMDILRRLPLWSLVQCRLVCKNWRDLTLDPYFPTLYFSGGTTCVTYVTSFEFCILGLKKNAADMSALTRFFPNKQVIIENSCNGLVCLRQLHKPEPIYIANPLTGEYITLPSYKGNPPVEIVTCLMGYCPNHNLYKVVKVVRMSCLKYWKAEICTVGFGSWRRINGYLPCEIDSVIGGVYLNGALHWVSSRHHYESIVITIELENERTLMLPLPHDFPLNRRGWWSKLCKLRDCLSIWRSKKSYADIEIWVMKEYGVKESWSKELVIKNLAIAGRLSFELITTLENGDILVSFCGQFYIYNPTKESFKSLLRHGIYGKSVPHVPSFISLRDVTRNSSKVLDVVQGRLEVFNLRSKVLDDVQERLEVFNLREYCRRKVRGFNLIF